MNDNQRRETIKLGRVSVSTPNETKARMTMPYRVQSPIPREEPVSSSDCRGQAIPRLSPLPSFQDFSEFEDKETDTEVSALSPLAFEDDADIRALFEVADTVEVEAISAMPETLDACEEAPITERQPSSFPNGAE